VIEPFPACSGTRAADTALEPKFAFIHVIS
jgi:hypothetical protein